MINLFKTHRLVYPLVVLLLVVCVSFGQATQFELWQDDNALIFKLQHLQEQVGVFGAGPFGLGAYRYIAVPYIPLYKIFDTNVAIFYIWAIFFYFLASVSVFFLAREFTKNNILALLSGSIFAAGFIGSDGILRLFNSIQTSYSVIFVSVFFLFLYRFSQLKRKFLYIIALVIFFLALETAFIRTQYLIFPTLIFYALFFNWNSIKEIKRNMLLLLPFLSIYYLVLQRGLDPRTKVLREFILGLLNGHLQYLHGFFGSLGNIILVSPVSSFLFESAEKVSLDYENRLLFLELAVLLTAVIFIWLISRKNRVIRFAFPLAAIGWMIVHVVIFHDQELIMRHSAKEDISGIFANFIGGLFLVTMASLSFLVKKKKVQLLLAFFLSWMSFNILAYSVYLPFLPLETIHRYLIHSLAAYAVVVPVFIYYFFGLRASVIVSAIIILSNILFSLQYQHKFITEKSIPTRKFYTSLKQYLPEIKKGSVFYFDVAEDEISQQQFRDFFSVGSMPDSTAIAIRYGLDRYDFAMTSNFEEFISLLDNKSLDSAFSFFYSTKGLENTTDKFRSNLHTGKKFAIREVHGLGKIDLSLVTPAVLEFRAKVLPFISTSQNCVALSPEQRRLIFDYIVSRDDFLKNTKVKTLSQEKYQKSNLLLDNNTNTLWRGGRGWWNDNEREEIILDLGRLENIAQFLWINGYANSTPLSYTIDTSLDGEIWQGAKRIMSESKKDNGERVVENFTPRTARFLRLSITHTFDNDSPAIGEVEAVESNFSNLDKDKFAVLEKAVYCAINEYDKEEISEFVRKRGIEGVISWETDKTTDNKVGVKLQPDGNYHTYKVFLPAGGTELRDLKIESGLVPAEVSISSIEITYPTLAELVQKYQ